MGSGERGEEVGDATARKPIEAFYAAADEMQAAHPGLRAHTAHPALGLACDDDGPVVINPPRDLGVRWMALPAAEQAQRANDFMRALLEHAADLPDARFTLGSWCPGAARSALRALPEVAWDEHACCSGPLTGDVIDVLGRVPCHGLTVSCDGRLFLTESSFAADRTGIEVWHDPWKAPAFQAQLEAAWWPAAEARARERAALPAPPPRDGGRVSREVRAAILCGWEHRGSKVVWVGAIAVLTKLVAETWLDALLCVAVLLTILFSIDGFLARWHRRS